MSQSSTALINATPLWLQSSILATLVQTTTMIAAYVDGDARAEPPYDDVWDSSESRVHVVDSFTLGERLSVGSLDAGVRSLAVDDFDGDDIADVAYATTSPRSFQITSRIRSWMPPPGRTSGEALVYKARPPFSPSATSTMMGALTSIPP